MDFAKMDERVVLIQYTESPDTYGQPTQTTSAIATVWAMVHEMTGKEVMNADQPVGVKPHVVTIRHRTDLDRLAHLTRADGTKLNFASIVKSDTRKDFLELACTEDT